jgi:glycosyltransferase involved in cell wall biosynthesis
MTGNRAVQREAPRPLVTVVIPAYNAEPWIGEAIESVIEQQLESWELIVVDDGSNDNTVAVVQGYGDPRIRVLTQETQIALREGFKGPSRTRNVGFRAARGRYIALLDADDWFEKRHLLLTTEFLEQHPECSLVTTNYHFVKSDGTRELGMAPGEVLGRPGDGVIDDFFDFPKGNRTFPITCGVVIRRRLLSDFGPFDESFTIAEDLEFWIRWALGSSFGYIDEPTSCYRIDVPGSNRKDLSLSIRMRRRVWQKLTASEDRTNPRWPSYAKFRSQCMFRLTAKAVATDNYDEATILSSIWPRSPGHIYWWLGRSLALMPRPIKDVMRGIVEKMGILEY